MQIDSYSIPECYASPTNLSISNEHQMQDAQACFNQLTRWRIYFIILQALYLMHFSVLV